MIPATDGSANSSPQYMVALTYLILADLDVLLEYTARYIPGSTVHANGYHGIQGVAQMDEVYNTSI